MTTVTFRWVFLLLLLITGITLVSGVYAEELIVAGPWDADNIDPHVSGWLPQSLGVIETLADVDIDGTLIPSLATSWEVSEDQKTWTFHLRDGVMFHDGTPFTAEAMKKSLEHSIEKSSSFKSLPIANIDATDKNTLKITLTKPFPSFPAYMAKGESGALSENCVAQGDVTSPIGTGPFSFVSYSPNQDYVIEKNNAYWGEKAKVDKVTWQVVPEELTRAMMLQSGDVDIIFELSPSVAQDLRSDSSVTVTEQPIARVRVIQYNAEKGPFADQKVRQAMNYGIDRQSLIDYVLEGVGTPAAGLFPPEFAWANKDISPSPYDPEKSKSMLAEAGWKDSDNDGILDKEGVPFRITFITYPERAEQPELAEVIQDELKKIGIDVELKVVDYDTCAEIQKTGDFDMYLVSRGTLWTPDPDDVMMSDYHSSGTFANGYGGYHWKSEQVDKLIEEARTTQDLQARKKMYDEVQQIIIDEAPVSYLSYYVILDAVSSKVQGFHHHPTELDYFLEDVSLG